MKQLTIIAKMAKSAIYQFQYLFINLGWAYTQTKNGNKLFTWVGSPEAVPVAVNPEESVFLENGYLADESGILTDDTQLMNQWNELDLTLNIPELEKIGFTEIPVDYVTKAKEFWSKDKDPFRTKLQGIGITDGFLFATDAHSMIYRKTSISEKVFLPSSLLTDVLSTKPVKLFYGIHENSQGLEMIFKSESKTGTYFVSGKYEPEPMVDYLCVIPQDNPVNVMINSVDLLAGVTKVKPAANKVTQKIDFSIIDGEINLGAMDIDLNREATAKVSCKASEPFSISFSARFIERATKAAKGAWTIYMSTPTRAAVIETEKDTILLMPILNHY